jgi:hypothetical protein
MYRTIESVLKSITSQQASVVGCNLTVQTSDRQRVSINVEPVQGDPVQSEPVQHSKVLQCGSEYEQDFRRREQLEDNYCELVNVIDSCGFDMFIWATKNCRICGPCEQAMKMFIILLISKLNGVPEFDDHSYDRLYSHIIRRFCGNEYNKNPLKYSDLPNLSIDELIEKQIIEGARAIGIKRFIVCLDELCSLGHIDDCEGRLDTTAFAQFVNAYFFLNEENFNRFIVYLYSSDCKYYQEYLESLNE